MNARVLINDKSNRFVAGEIGKVLESDFSKYDYFLELEGTEDFQILGMGHVPRRYYFYRHEIELFDDVSNESAYIALEK